MELCLNLFQIVLYVVGFALVFYVARFLVIPFAMYLEGGKYCFYSTRFDKETKLELPLSHRYITLNSLRGYVISVDKKVVRKFIIPDSKAEINVNDSMKMNDADLEIIRLIMERKKKVGETILSIIKTIILLIINTSLLKIILSVYEKINSLNRYMIAFLFVLIAVYILIKFILVLYLLNLFDLRISLLIEKSNNQP